MQIRLQYTTLNHSVPDRRQDTTEEQQDLEMSFGTEQSWEIAPSIPYAHITRWPLSHRPPLLPQRQPKTKLNVSVFCPFCEKTHAHVLAPWNPVRVQTSKCTDQSIQGKYELKFPFELDNKYAKWMSYEIDRSTASFVAVAKGGELGSANGENDDNGAGERETVDENIAMQLSRQLSLQPSSLERANGHEGIEATLADAALFGSLLEVKRRLNSEAERPSYDEILQALQCTQETVSNAVLRERKEAGYTEGVTQVMNRKVIQGLLKNLVRRMEREEDERWRFEVRLFHDRQQENQNQNQNQTHHRRQSQALRSRDISCLTFNLGHTDQSKRVAILDRGPGFPLVGAVSGWTSSQYLRHDNSQPANSVQLLSNGSWLGKVERLCYLLGYDLGKERGYGGDAAAVRQYNACHVEKQLIAYFLEKHTLIAVDVGALSVDLPGAGWEARPEIQDAMRDSHDKWVFHPPGVQHNLSISVHQSSYKNTDGVCACCMKFIECVNSTFGIKINVHVHPWIS